jgi:glycosyltransferase involved in cell wall biosynthesis
MRLLLLHNYYRLMGGEDLSFEAEADLLERHGHEVVRYTVRNDDLDPRGRVGLALDCVWNRSICAELRSLAERTRPQVAHFYNTFPRLSPAAYRAVRGAGAAVVQTVSNYRVLCVNALLFRRGRVCEECVGSRVPWRGVLHGCYRDSRKASAVVAAMVAFHRLARTWDRTVDVFLARSDFTASRLSALNLRRAVIRVKASFVDAGQGLGSGEGGYAVFVGRLSAEKGIETLIAAWRQLGNEVPLRIVGEGPMASVLARAGTAGVELVGQRLPREVLALIGEAKFLVLPSIWPEVLARVAIEAFSQGTPVVASRLGGLPKVVEDGRTGLLFRGGDARDLVSKVRLLVADPERLARMRLAARATFEALYTPERNYDQLMDIYEFALARRAARG